jgi:hypothetical protein
MAREILAQEVVDVYAYRRLGEGAIELVDPALKAIITFIENETGEVVTINNWHKGGHLSNRGYRSPESEIGGTKSQHRKGKALDLNIGNWSVKRMYEFILQHAAELYSLGLRRIEDISLTKTWLHMDTKEHNLADTIIIVDLTKVTGKITWNE